MERWQKAVMEATQDNGLTNPMELIGGLLVMLKS